MTENPAKSSLAQEVRASNSDPILGLKVTRIETNAVDESEVDDFLHRLRTLLEQSHAFDVPLESQHIHAIAESAIDWHQHKYQLYPLYMERLHVVDDAGETNIGVSGIRVSAGEWTVCAKAIQSADAITKLAAITIQNPQLTGGLAVNVLTVPPGLLKQEYDVRPLVLHALAPDGTACDRGRPLAQAAIVNAFWQTFWATGARRAERGSVFPVAFLPIDRTWPGEFQPPFREREILPHRRVFGRSSILAFFVEALTGGRGLYFDCEANRFVVTEAFAASGHELSDDDIALTISELNRTAFVDAYTGENSTRFSTWAETESGLSTQPFHAQSFAQLIVLAESDLTDQHVRINRVVPYSGCAYLNEVVNSTDELRRIGKIQDLDDQQILAATNSTFFLNFPEEYTTLHSAMNDAVTLLVENSRTIQTKTMHRAAFVLSKAGKPSITIDADVHVNTQALQSDADSMTYFQNAHLGFAKNEVGPLAFGTVVVGSSVVETFSDTTVEVPANGWVASGGEAVESEFQPANSASAWLASAAGTGDAPIRHAFAVGPLLVQGGKTVPLGESGEQFQPIVLIEPPAFEESRECTRTGIPPTLLKCEKRGVPPTRFPYDWDHTRAPRTAIGITADGTVHLVVVDGRADLAHSIGATLAELAQIMLNLGCRDAMNMDGGGSSVMFVNDPRATQFKMRPELRDGVVNLPSDLGGVERLLPVPLVITRKAA